MTPILYLADFTLFVLADPMATFPFWKSHPALFAAFAVVVAAVFRGTLQRTRGKGAVAWSLGWMVLTLLPVATLTVAEHFLYLPSVGYCILVGSQVPRSPADVAAAARRPMAIVGVLVLVIALVRTWLFDGAARDGARAIERAAIALDHAPAAETLLVANLPAAASLAFPQAVRAARPDRDVRTEILSITSSLRSRPTDPALVTFSPPDRFVVRREEPLLRSYIERALLGPRPPFQVGERIERSGYSVRVTDAAPEGLRAFEVQVEDPSHTLVLDEGPSR
jgi:hypothetical protein